jgi:hypothetical protein
MNLDLVTLLEDYSSPDVPEEKLQIELQSEIKIVHI